MKVGIIGAMAQEIVFLREKIERPRLSVVAGVEICSGILNGVDVILLTSGIGKVAAAMGTTLLLDRYQPDVVINTGTAGGLAPMLEVGDIVISNAVQYHDVDVTAFGYTLGQMAGCSEKFIADSELIISAEAIVSQLGLRAMRGLILSGDSFINGAAPLERIRANFPQAIAVDMEATAIAHVCHQFSKPFVITRAISDLAGKSSHLSFDAFLEVAAKNSSLMVEALIRHIASSTPIGEVDRSL